MKNFDFKTQMIMSAGFGVAHDVSSLLLENIPGAVRVTKANERDDRSGTDYWIEHQRGTPISVDTKVRGEDPIEKRGKDDLALETWSVVDTKIGWTLDETKRTDYVLWLFKPTQRWVLIPFLQLQHAFKKRADEWTTIYPVFKQNTKGSRGDWQSECVFVPRIEIWRAIHADFGGAVRSTPGSEVPHVIRRHGSKREIVKPVRIPDSDPRDTCADCGDTAKGKSLAMFFTVTDGRNDERVVCAQCWRKGQQA